MEKELMEIVRGLKSKSAICANTYMRAIDTLKEEHRPVPMHWKKTLNKCMDSVLAYDKALELAGEQAGTWGTDEIDEKLYNFLVEGK